MERRRNKARNIVDIYLSFLSLLIESNFPNCTNNKKINKNVFKNNRNCAYVYAKRPPEFREGE